MSKSIKLHLRAVRKRLNKISENIEGYEYWENQNKKSVSLLEKEDIRIHFKVVNNHLEHLSEVL